MDEGIELETLVYYLVKILLACGGNNYFDTQDALRIIANEIVKEQFRKRPA